MAAGRQHLTIYSVASKREVHRCLCYITKTRTTPYVTLHKNNTKQNLEISNGTRLLEEKKEKEKIPAACSLGSSLLSAPIDIRRAPSSSPNRHSGSPTPPGEEEGLVPPPPPLPCPRASERPRHYPGFPSERVDIVRVADEPVTSSQVSANARGQSLHVLRPVLVPPPDTRNRQQPCPSALFSFLFSSCSGTAGRRGTDKAIDGGGAGGGFEPVLYPSPREGHRLACPSRHPQSGVEIVQGGGAVRVSLERLRGGGGSHSVESNANVCQHQRTYIPLYVHLSKRGRLCEGLEVSYQSNGL